MAFVAVSTSQLLAATSTSANVTFAASTSGSFRVTNADGSDYVFVTINNSDVAAVAPTAGTPANGIAIAPNSTEIIGGNFGAANTSTIYVAAVCPTGSANI